MHASARRYAPRVLGLCLAMVVGAARANPPEVPALQTRVTDTLSILDAAARSGIERRLRDFEAAKGSQVAVLIVATTQPETIEQYGIRVADAWDLGREAEDDGVILIVAVEDRKVRIEVGRGLEGALNDATCKRIIEDFITPHFRSGDYAAGIQTGLERIIAVTEGEALPPPLRTRHERRPGDEVPPILPLLVAMCFVVVVLRSLFSRLASGATVGLATGVLAGLITGSILAALLAALALLFLAFIVPSHFLATAIQTHMAMNRMGGGGFRSGGFGGGGGGGFRGGGGSFGGGGASGGW